MILSFIPICKRTNVSDLTFIGHPWKDINLQVHFSIKVFILFHIFKLNYI
jgi:hypothetical protein